jgi:hypothetical protein
MPSLLAGLAFLKVKRPNARPSPQSVAVHAYSRAQLPWRSAREERIIISSLMFSAVM